VGKGEMVARKFGIFSNLGLSLCDKPKFEVKSEE
jgi:hypothetical protein